MRSPASVCLQKFSLRLRELTIHLDDPSTGRIDQIVPAASEAWVQPS